MGKPIDNMKVNVTEDGEIEIETPWDNMELDKSLVARCSHVTRRIVRGEPLTGKVLETALDAIDFARRGKADEFLETIAGKLNEGKELNDYESHFMREAILPGYKFASENQIEKGEVK
jgi:hypothetical protein